MSTQILPDEEVFFGKYCWCGHFLNDPEEHNFGRCFEQEDNPIIYSVCPCRNPYPLNLRIKVELPIDANNSTNISEPAPSRKVSRR